MISRNGILVWTKSVDIPFLLTISSYYPEYSRYLLRIIAILSRNFVIFITNNHDIIVKFCNIIANIRSIIANNIAKFHDNIANICDNIFVLWCFLSIIPVHYGNKSFKTLRYFYSMWFCLLFYLMNCCLKSILLVYVSWFIMWKK